MLTPIGSLVNIQGVQYYLPDQMVIQLNIVNIIMAQIVYNMDGQV